MTSELLTLIAAAQTRADALSARLDAMESRLGLPPMVHSGLISAAQAAGILDVTPETLRKLPLKARKITPKAVKYVLSEVIEFRDSTRE